MGLDAQTVMCYEIPFICTDGDDEDDETPQHSDIFLMVKKHLH